MRLAPVPILVVCALAVGCAGGDDSEPARVATDATSKAAPESSAGDSGAPAEASKQQHAQKRRARPDRDARRGRNASPRGETDDLIAALGLGGGRKTARPAPDAQDPRALLEALKGKRRSQQSRPSRDSGLPSAVDRLLGERSPAQ